MLFATVHKNFHAHVTGLARRLITGILIVITGSGCSTQRLWEQANESPVSLSQVIGVGESRPDHRRWLVVRYGADADAPVLRVPLDADGRPLPPFGWADATLPPGRGFFDQVSDAQRRQIDTSAVLQPAGETGPLTLPTLPVIDFATDATLVLAAYRLTPDGRPEPVKLPAAAPTSDLSWTPFAPDVRVVVLPMSRIDAARTRDKKFRAVALTPFTVLGDATVVALIAATAGGFLYVLSRTNAPLNGSWFAH